MWEPRRLTTPWPPRACYRDSFFFLPFISYSCWAQKLTLRSSALKKFAKCALQDTGTDRSAHALNLATVTQEAAISFPNGTVLMPPFRTASALDPVILECMCMSCTSS
jgi:hypothetical protein